MAKQGKAKTVPAGVRQVVNGVATTSGSITIREDSVAYQKALQISRDRGVGIMKAFQLLLEQFEEKPQVAGDIVGKLDAILDAIRSRSFSPSAEPEVEEAVEFELNFDDFL